MKYNGLVCDNCGKIYNSNQCGKFHHFCCIECRRQAGKLVASSFSPEVRQATSKRLTEINKTILNKPEYVEKRRLKLMGAKPGSYIKDHGKHLHRIVAEQKIGRPLKSNEVVHHIDGNKHNNSPENLQVLTQSEHIKIHLAKHNMKLMKEGDCIVKSV